MLKQTISCSLLAIGLLLQCCYYDNEAVLYKNGGGTVCDTTNVTYSQTIAPIMSNNCNSCHWSGAGIGVITIDYTNLNIIVANGKLSKSVNWTGGAIPMPLGGQKLSSCDLDKITKWINNGALNN
jgi:hypothetical protein